MSLPGLTRQSIEIAVWMAWEDGQVVYKPNYMPKKYAIAIVPISGFLVSVAALASVLEDSLRATSAARTAWTTPSSATR
jgi:hypothetical protein